MAPLISLSVASLLPLASASLLYTTHYSGQVATLNLQKTSSGSYDLKVTSNITACGAWPSWLTYSADQKVLYCSDESFRLNGSLTTFDVATDGALTQTAKIVTMGGGVNSLIYNGGKNLAIAHYQSSSISSFKLPITASTTASQVFTFTLAKPGPNPGRQDAPHPHQVLADPTGKFILSPDLGADLIRIYSINTESGELTTCPSYAVAPGSGPRHMAFWSVPASYSQHVGGGSSRSKAAALTTYLYLASELTNSVSAFNVVYPATGAESNCLTLKLRQTVSNYPNGTVLPTPTPQIGEIKVKGNTVYVTNRNDDSFGVGVDSFVTYGICPNSGSITPQRFFSSEAEWPRTLVLNSKGDLAVVGGQVSSEVVVFARDVKTGQLGDVVARAVTGIRGDTSGNGGMSSAILAE